MFSNDNSNITQTLTKKIAKTIYGIIKNGHFQAFSERKIN